MSRIVHISTVHPTYDQRIFHRECVSLARAGYKVSLLVHSGDGDGERDGVTIQSLGNNKRPGLKLRPISRLMASLRAGRLASQIDANIYHIHDPELILLGLWLRWRTRTNVIFDCHENFVGFARQRYYLHPAVRSVLAWGIGVLERLAARRLDVIITADQGVAEIYRNYGAQRIVTVHNFPRLDLFPDDIFKHTLKTYDLVYHGSIPRYHLEIAFAVATELAERGRVVHWLFMGHCPEEAWARAEIRRRGLDDLFILTGPIPHEDVAAVICSARIGFIPLPDLPKFQQNIPTKLFELMALGMPVILSDLPPSRPFVGDGKCAIMIPPNDYSSYADAIELLLDDPIRCTEMGLEGRRRIEQLYNWQMESGKLLDLYSKILRE